MQNPRKDFNPGVLLGRCVEQICFTVNQMALHFDANVDIVVESGFIYRDPRATEIEETGRFPVMQSGVMALLERSIEQPSVDVDWNLILTFAGDLTLVILRDSDQYECYHLRIGQDEIVI